MESGMTGAPAMGQNPAAQDLIGTVSANERSVLLYVHMFLKNIKKI